MAHAAEMHRCIADMDVVAARRLWAHIAPGATQPADEHDALATLHYARSRMVTMPLRSRAYSHRWLLDHGLPSGLPDALKPRAERLYPTIADAVGISTNARQGSIYEPIVPFVQAAAENAVLECYADGHRAPAIVKSRIAAAKRGVIRKLLGV